MAVKKNAKKSVKKVSKKAVKKTVKKPSAKTAKKKVTSKSSPKKTVKKAAPVKSVGTAPASTAGSDKASCQIIEKDGRSFIIVVNQARNFFDLQEMRTLVNICHSAMGEFDGAQRLFSWFQNKRKDVLIDTQISSPSDQSLRTIYKYLINHYSVKQS